MCFAKSCDLQRVKTINKKLCNFFSKDKTYFIIIRLENFN